MKKVAVAALLSVFVGASAHADDGFYAGVNLGRTNVDTPYPGASMTNSTDTVFGALVGYQFNQYWGIETFYTGAGKWSVADNVGNIASGKANVFGVEAVGTLPLSDALAIYGKLGIANTKTTATNTDITGTIVTDMSASRNAAAYGLGGIYNIDRNVSIRFGWDRYSASIVDVSGNNDNFNSNVFSWGAVFKF